MPSTRPVPASRAAAEPPAWALALFAGRLTPRVTDAGTGQVLVWSLPDTASDARVSEQFTANAAEYHQRYAASDHFERLFRQALPDPGDVAAQPLILDLGSGSGVNSVVPCLNLYEGARIVATDLSAELLVMLAQFARQGAHAEAVACVAMDAMTGRIPPGRFDLVTGASILHHLERPQEGIGAAFQALKPGGKAIFFEPFDGYGLMRLAYERILAEAELRADPLHPLVEKALRDMVFDIKVRSAPDPAGPIFKALDDKWLFSREGMEAMAREAGFADVRFLAHKDHGTLYQKMGAVQIRLSSGMDDLTLPAWADAILAAHDEAITSAGKRMLMLEGTIVLTR